MIEQYLIEKVERTSCLLPNGGSPEQAPEAWNMDFVTDQLPTPKINSRNSPGNPSGAVLMRPLLPLGLIEG